MKAMGRGSGGAKRGPMAGLANMLGMGGGGMGGGGMPSPEEMAKLAEKLPGCGGNARRAGSAARPATGHTEPAAEFSGTTRSRSEISGRPARIWKEEVIRSTQTVQT